LFNNWDVDGGGTIEFEEFKKCMVSKWKQIRNIKKQSSSEKSWAWKRF
jgi:hypothetical protein